MVKLKGKGLRILKAIHLLGVICWCGGCVTSLLMILRLTAISEAESLQQVLYLLETIDLYIIAAAAMFTVCVGLVYGIFTSWGFKKVRWVLVKWVLSLGIIITGTAFYIPMLEQMRGIISAEGIAAVASAAFQTALLEAQILFCCHLAAMIFMVFISVLRPWTKVKKA